MKKSLKVLCALALFATVPTVLTACGDTSSIVDENQDIVNSALKELNVNAEVTASFTLPISARGGVTIAWESDNSAITVNGSDATVTQSLDEDVSVKLTATATKGNATGTREFTVVVKKMEITTEYITAGEALQAAPGTEVTVRGVVVQILMTAYQSTARSGFYVASNDGVIYCFGTNTANQVERGQDVLISGTTAAYPTTVTYTTQLSNISLVATLSTSATANLDTTKFETKTVTEVCASTNAADYSGKTFLFKNVKINKYVTTYTSYSLFEYDGVVTDSSTPKFNLYSSQGDNGMTEYEWLDEYLDKKVDVLFVINSLSSKSKWRGSVVSVFPQE